MIELLALRNLVLRPWRSAFLLFGYSLGVAVMIVLLSIGEALLAQSRDEKLVGGGEITVLPEGIDVEVMKTGGLGGMFFSIDHARFIYAQLLAAPRLAPFVVAVAPQIESKLLYARTRGGRELPVLAGGEIPSRTAAVGAMPPLAAGAWADDSSDRAWRDPRPDELRHAIDHFHLPPVEARRDPTWAEWHYFNVLSADKSKWAFISFIVAGAIPDSAWGGQVLVTLHRQGGESRRFVATVPRTAVRFSTSRADVAIGSSTITVRPDGRYAVHARATEEGGSSSVDVNLVVSPAPGAYFPGGALSGETVSGYVVPALRADATGSICVNAQCDLYEATQSYHDHNWGVWRGVTWEWGAARAGVYTLLYGRVQPSDTIAAAEPLFTYVVDSLGFLALFRPREIHYEDTRVVRVGGQTIHVPGRGTMIDVRGDDTLAVELIVEDATATDTRKPGAERGDGLASRQIARPYFVQMKGRMRISGRVGGKQISGEGAGFFETYR
ncbi:MAG: MacB-like periplasmic core domain protein [Gemmatimonadetes bacterium]|nr:MacB-like periplasmic core domain protein [Gemmatimonadota bacterium]